MLTKGLKCVYFLYKFCIFVRISLLRQMQESRYAVCQTSVFIVDERIEHPGHSGERHYIVICDGGWNQATVAFLQHYLVTRGSDHNLAVSLYAHADDEAVVFHKVSVERPRHLRHSHAEIR